MINLPEWTKAAAAFPRPDRIRQDYICLDGEWAFALDRFNTGIRSGWHKSGSLSDKIRVPFCVEAKASGVVSKFPPNIMWYARKFDCPESFLNKGGALLHFGASDYKTEVYLNGELLGTHTGGFTSFSFDAAGYLRAGENLLVVRVKDTLDPRIPRGKQSPIGIPFSIIYTPVSGIWQSVWIESVGEAHLRDIDIRPNLDTGEVNVSADIAGKSGDYELRLQATAPDGSTFTTKTVAKLSGRSCSASVSFNTGSPAAWAPGTPNLYRLHIDVVDSSGAVQDSLDTHFGFRTIEVKNGQILLNGKKLYMKLLLNQGYFPEGHYTPMDWDLFRADAAQVLDMGFNGLRMHQKIENPKFLFWCDVYGLLVWEEMPSAWLWSDIMRRALRHQWTEAIRRDRNHPCIIAWTPFNESWGVNNLIWSEKVRSFMKEMVAMTHALDPTRPVIDNSGFEHVQPEILDLHHYLGTLEQCREYYEKLRDPKNMEFNNANIYKRLKPHETPAVPLAPGVKHNGAPVMVSEYGGFGFYKTSTGKGLFESVREFTLAIAECDYMWGYCYTQQYDTELEQNGLLEFDRKPKFPLEQLRSMSAEVDALVKSRWGGDVVL